MTKKTKKISKKKNNSIDISLNSVVDDFNKKCPIGGFVTVERPIGYQFVTKTIGKAFIDDNNLPVVTVEKTENINTDIVNLSIVEIIKTKDLK